MAGGRTQAIAEERGLTRDSRRRKLKEAFKARCREQLHEQRRRAFEKNRCDDEQDLAPANGIAAAMQSQLHAWPEMVDGAGCARAAGIAHTFHGASGLHTDAADVDMADAAGSAEHIDIFAPPTHDELMELWDEIAEELMIEENRQAADDRIQDEKRADEEIQAEQAAIQEAMVHAEDVVCPQCQSHALELRAMVIFCRCGFRLNTHSDSLTLKDFENMLMRVLEAHRATGCRGNVKFQNAATMGVPMLCASCETCGASELL